MTMKPDNTFSILNNKPKEYFNLIPQTGVTHLLCEDFPTHNAVWDMVIGDDGRVFFPACGESYVSEYARLFEYDHKNKKLIHHFNLEDKITLRDETLRTSKFHTALSYMEDGRLIATTHTTSPSPLHPTWMPYEYANHQWEGFPGSDLVIYDPKTGVLENKGTLTPYDTAYGGTYCPKTGDYFCITWMRGTGYTYNVHTGEKRCLGQVSDTATSRTFLCSDGHIYGSTYSGKMFRYNSDTREVEYLDADIKDLMRHAREKDGVLYITTGPCSVDGRGQMLFAYDMKTGKVKEIGRPVPKIDYSGNENNVFYNAYGMDFDSQGRLWYGCMTFTPQIKYAGVRLYMWDFLNGKEPVDLGFLGTKKRTLSITAEFNIKDDVIYISDGNHTSDEELYCGIIAIDLKEFVPAIETEERIPSHDYMNYLPFPLECSKYYPLNDFEENWNKFYKKYQFEVEITKFKADNYYIKPYPEVKAISYWEEIGRENTKVNKIEWKDNNNISIYCGTDKTYKIDVDLNTEEHKIVPYELVCENELKVPVADDVKLPFMAGRQYIAKANASVKMNDCSVIVGTKDLMLAKIKDNKVKSLGAVTPCGSVNSLVACGDTVYGVAGYPKGPANMFRYDDENGIEQLGYVPTAFAKNGRKVNIFNATTLSLSPDNKYLAVGGADELSGVIVIKLD